MLEGSQPHSLWAGSRAGLTGPGGAELLSSCVFSFLFWWRVLLLSLSGGSAR